MRLTRSTVAALTLPVGKSELLVFDDTLPGFGVRIRSGGKRTWIAQYRIGSKQRRVTLGTVETLDLDRAKQAAKETLARVHLGGDPQTEKAEARTRAAVTLHSVAERAVSQTRRIRFAPLFAKPTQQLTDKLYEIANAAENFDARLLHTKELRDLSLSNSRITLQCATAGCTWLTC
jgi:hypothetical protein